MAVPRLRHECTVRICNLVESKQLLSVGAADLQSISFGNFRGIKPRTALQMILEWIVDREQHAIGANGENGVNERLGAEMSAGADVKIAAEVIGHAPLRRTVRHLVETMIEPP